MTRVFVYEQSGCREASAVDPAWLQPGSPVIFWVDLAAPTPEEGRLLSDVFHFHELAVEDAMSAIHHPKIESYDKYLYLILHGIDFSASTEGFATHDIDFFLGPNYLVTVHDGTSRSVAEQYSVCLRNAHAIGEGPAGLLHRIVDALVDHYRPEVERLEGCVDELETRVFEHPEQNPIRELIQIKKDLASLRRVTLPQRDAVSRLARREFAQIPESVTWRMRDVYDHLVRLSEESVVLHDRVASLVDAFLSAQSNRLNQVMKLMTVIATIFMPLTVLTGMFGMNVDLPVFPGGERAQFWWITAIMVAVMGVMLTMFRRRRWI
ncbi:MAG: magnesium/cobalt transporter CorA [Acidobacteriota bacterium]|nr:magnesium/cobalt transporter CorA [Acidobacteriota bacterium]